MEKNNIIHLSERSENMLLLSILSFFLFFTIYIETYGIGDSTFLRVLFYIVLFFSPVLLIAAINSIRQGFKNLRLKQLIEGTATSKIRSLAIGFAEVYGKTFNEPIIKAPLSGNECVYWHVIAFEIDDQTNEFLTIGNYSSKDNFFIKDDTGKVSVEPKNAQFERLHVGLNYSPYGKFSVNDMPPKVTRTVAFPNGYSLTRGIAIKGRLIISKDGKIIETELKNEPPENLSKFCRQHGIRLKEASGKLSDLIILEYYLPANKGMYVMGTVAENPTEPNNMLMTKGQYVDFFYISDKHEKEAVKDISKRAERWIIGAGALASINTLTIMLNWDKYLQAINYIAAVGMILVVIVPLVYLFRHQLLDLSYKTSPKWLKLLIQIGIMFLIMIALMFAFWVYSKLGLIQYY